MEKVVLSYSGGTSPVGISSYLSCPQKVKHRLEGWTFKKRPDYFVFGTYFHRMVELELTDQIDISPEEYIETIEELDMREILKLNLCDFRLHNDHRPIEQEIKVEGCLTNPITGEKHPDIIMQGRVDLVEIFEGKKTITDFKTSSMINQVEFDDYAPQVFTYAYLYWMATGEFVDQVSLVLFNKKEPPKKPSDKTPPRRRRLLKKVCKEDLLIAYEQALKVARGIQAGDFTKNTCSCVGKYSTCEYYPLCFPHRYEYPEAQIGETLTKFDPKIQEQNNVLDFSREA